MTGAWKVALWALGGLVACGCGGDDAESEHSTTLGFCDVAPVLESYCWRCHSDPPANFAPFPLTTWEKTQENHPGGSGKPIWQHMETMVSQDLMPPTTFPLEPPVEPLPEAEKAKLLEWLRAGAPEGDCQ